MTTQEVAVVGETQRFECQVIGFPTPTITWYKDEVDITHNPRYNISFDEDLGIITLMIKGVSLADEGCYVCRAENTEGFATTTAYLVVRVEGTYDAKRDFSAMSVEKITEEEHSQVEVIKAGRSTIIEEVITHIEETEKEVFEEKTVAPKITYEARLKDKLSFKEGATIYLEVNFTGYPQPQVTWYHDDSEISESASITMETMDGWSYLKVKGTTSRDTGIYKVVAENVAGRDSAEFRIVIKSPPSSPRNLHVVEVYKDYIIIAWDEPEHTGGDNILGYQVEKTLSGDKFVTAGYADSDTTKLKVTKLFEGTDYVFRVSAENRVGLGPPVTLDRPVKAKLPFDPPGCPRNLRVTETNKDYITVAWDKPENNGGSDIIQYIIEKRDATRGGSMWIVAGTVDGGDSSFRCTKLFQGNKYLFRVSAENRVGPGQAAELMEPVIAKLPFDKPLPPRNLRAVETNRDYIVITWEAPESDGGAAITNYVLEKHDAKHPGYIYMAEVDADTFQYKATRLFEGYEYYFQVIAENQVGPSDPCETNKPIKAKLPFDEPDRPGNLRVKEYWTDYITVTWDAPANDGGSPIMGYIIEKRDVSRQNWIKAGTVGSDVTTFKIGNLFEGAQYLIRVFAENKVGPSKEAAELDTPCKAKMPFDPPFAPQTLKVIDFNTDYITISWQPPENDGGAPIKGYIIEKHDTHMPMWMQAATVDKDTLSFKVENLFEGQSYEFRVAAENECGRGHYIQTEKPTQARLPYNKPSIPRGLRVTDVWSDYISLLWEEPESDGGSPLTGYTIEQRDAYEAAYRFVVALGADVTSYQVTNLKEGHDYYFRVYSQNAAGLSERPAEIKPPVKAKLPYDKPPCPRSVKCTGTGPGTISIEWDAPESDGGTPITQYHIETCRTTLLNYSRVATVEGTTTAFDITGLVDGADYYVRIYAENKAGESKRFCELEEPVKAMKPIYKPGTPANLRVTDTNKDHISIAWDAPESDGGAEITNYLIESRSDLDLGYVPIAKVDSVITNYTARALLEGTDYNFRVKARNAAGVSEEGVELSKPVTARLPFDPPAAPRNLQVTSVNKYEISLAWEVPEFDGGSKLTGYTVEMRSALDKKYRCLRTLDATATSYTAVGLTEGKEYYFRIRAKNDAGVGEPVELKEPVKARVPCDVPKEPKNLEVVNTDASSVAICWQPPETDGGSPLINYVIEMRSAKETKYKTIGKVSADTLSYTALDLKEGSKYTFRVKAENIAGTSDACKLDKAVKVEAKLVPPNCPTNLAVSEANKDRVTLTWAAPEKNKTNPIGSYVVEMKASGEVDFVPVGKVDAKKTTYTVKKLEAGEKYEFRVKAKNEAGLSVDGAELTEPVVLQTAKEQKKVKEPTKEEIKKDKSLESEEIKTEQKETKQKKAKEEEPKIEKVKEEVKEPEQEESKKAEPKVEKSKKREPKEEEKEKPAEPKEEKKKKAETKEKETKKVEPKEEKHDEVKTREESVSLPSAPVDLMVESVSDDNLTVTWSPSPNDGGSAIQHYIIVMREAVKKKFKKVGKVSGGTLKYSITSNIQPAKEYFIRVYAENSAGISESAAEIDSAVKITSEVIKKDEVEIVEEQVEVTESKVTEAEPQSEAKITTEAQTAPKPEQTSEEEITSEKQQQVSAEKPQTVPSAPTNLIVKEVNSSSVTLSWDAPIDAGNTEITSYLIVMREAEKNKFKKVGQTNGTTLTLTVTKVKEGHQYFFRVYAENKIGISEDMAELDDAVKIPAKEPTERVTQEPADDQLDATRASGAPVITAEPQPVAVKEGDTIRLTCRVTGMPDTEVLWLKDGKKLKSSKKNDINLDRIGDLCILRISNATQEDIGEYTVQATNRRGNAEYNVFVSMAATAMEDVHINSTDSLSAVIHQRATVEEERINEPLSTAVIGSGVEQIQVQKLKLDEDEFVSKRKLLGPAIEVAPMTTTVSIGDTIKLFCRIKGVTSGGVTWEKDGTFLSPTKLKKRGRCYYDEKEDLHVLEIHNATDSDAGEYSFDAFNDYGLVSGICTITVDGVEADKYEDAEVHPKSAAKAEAVTERKISEETKSAAARRGVVDKDTTSLRDKSRKVENAPMDGLDKPELKAVSDRDVQFGKIDIEAVGLVTEEEIGEASVSRKGMAPMMAMMKSKKDRPKAKTRPTEEAVTKIKKGTVEDVCMVVDQKGTTEEKTRAHRRATEQSSSEYESETEESESVSEETSENESSSTSSSATSAASDESPVKVTKKVTKKVITTESVISRTSTGRNQEVGRPSEATVSSQTGDNDDLEKLDKQGLNGRRVKDLDAEGTSEDHKVADAGEPLSDENGSKKKKKKCKEKQSKPDPEDDLKVRHKSRSPKPDRSGEHSTFTSEQTKEEIKLQAKNGDVFTESRERTETTETTESTTVTQNTRQKDSTRKTPKAKKVSSRKDTKSALELRRARIMRLGPPQILMSPESLIIPEGDAIRLKYKVTGDPEPQVTWYKDDVELVPTPGNSRLRIYHLNDEDLDIVEILNSTEEDVGEYMLKASNEGGRVSAMVTVNVCKPELFYQLASDEMLADIMEAEEETVSMATKRESIIREAEVRVREKQPRKVALAETRPSDEMNINRKPAPKFEIMPEPQSLVQGEDIKLSCKAAGDPAPKVTWFKDEEKLLPKMYDGRVDISWDAVDQISQLEVRNVTSQDSGDYTAQAANPGGIVTASVAVTIDDEATDEQSVDAETKKSKVKIVEKLDVEVQSKTLRDGERRVKRSKKKDKPETVGKDEGIVGKDKKGDEKTKKDPGIDESRTGSKSKLKSESESESETESESESESASESEVRTEEEEAEEDAVQLTESTPAKGDEKDRSKSEKQRRKGKGGKSRKEIIEMKTEVKVKKIKDGRTKTDTDSPGEGKKERKSKKKSAQCGKETDDSSPKSDKPVSKKEQVKCAPFFEMVPSKVICVNEGDDIVLKCRLRGHPEPKVSLYKDDVEIRPKEMDPRIHVVSDVSANLIMFTIKKATKADAGVYIIRADNGVGTECCTVSVSVEQDVVAEDEEGHAECGSQVSTFKPRYQTEEMVDSSMVEKILSERVSEIKLRDAKECSKQEDAIDKHDVGFEESSSSSEDEEEEESAGDVDEDSLSASVTGNSHQEIQHVGEGDASDTVMASSLDKTIISEEIEIDSVRSQEIDDSEDDAESSDSALEVTDVSIQSTARGRQTKELRERSSKNKSLKQVELKSDILIQKHIKRQRKRHMTTDQDDVTFLSLDYDVEGGPTLGSPMLAEEIIILKGEEEVMSDVQTAGRCAKENISPDEQLVLPDKHRTVDVAEKETEAETSEMKQARKPHQQPDGSDCKRKPAKFVVVPPQLTKVEEGGTLELCCKVEGCI